MEGLLHALGLQHLSATLGRTPLAELETMLSVDGRPRLLSYLKELGVTKLPERQKLATAVAKLAKGASIGELSGAAAPAVTASPSLRSKRVAAPLRRRWSAARS